ncbi:MAG: ankyrin repeat domain-containing protein [Candidatus Krumholzibacteriales bacterium]
MKRAFIYPAVLFLLLAAFSLPAKTADQDSFNELAGSIYMRDLEKVKELIESGMDVNIRQEMSGSSPLMVACALEGTDDIIRYLLEKGAEVRVKDKKGYTPLMWASENSLAAVNMLIEAGAGADAVAEDGMTPLIRSVFGIITGDVTTEVCDTLLANGADINAALTGSEAGGLSALLFAANKKMPGLVGYLVSKGADVNHREAGGQTALMRAAGEGDLETVRILIEAGADPEIESNDGETALSIAEKREKAEVAEYLKSL